MSTLPLPTTSISFGRGSDKASQLALFKTPESPQKPFLRWAGGKTRLLSKILPHLPGHIENYYEPFLGGGAVYFAIRRQIHGICHLYDLNEDLVDVWQTVRDKPDLLLRAIEDYHGLDKEEQYYTVRGASP